jgi:hypothetical protein
VADNTLTIGPKDRQKEVGRVVAFLLSFAPEKPINLRFTVAKQDRSSEENRYLWAVPYKMLSEHTGFEVEEISEYLCGMHFGWKEKKLPGGRTVEVPRRTTTKDENGERDVLKFDEFWKYVRWIQRVGDNQGIRIPDPDKNYKIARQVDNNEKVTR